MSCTLSPKARLSFSSISFWPFIWSTSSFSFTTYAFFLRRVFFACSLFLSRLQFVSNICFGMESSEKLNLEKNFIIEVYIRNHFLGKTLHTFVSLFHLHSCASVCVMICRLDLRSHTNHEQQPQLLLHPGVVSLYMSEKLARCDEFNVICRAVVYATYHCMKIGVFWHSKPVHKRCRQWKWISFGVFFGDIIEVQ